MASFSFGDGNARKILAIPRYAAGWLLARVVPRSTDEWVFGSAAGIADGALAVWDHARAAGQRAVWLVSGPEQAAAAAERHIAAVPRSSARGLWRTLRARVIVITHGFGDVNPYGVSGAFVVQLWHGIPLKRIGIDAPETVRSSLLPSSRVVRCILGAMYRSATRRIRLLPAASHLVRGRLESAFSLRDEQVPVLGEPRVDVLSQGTAEQRRRDARDRLGELIGPLEGPVVLYAPTWRDGDDDPAVPDAEDWTAICRTLACHEAVLLIRSHPLGAGDYAPPAGEARVRMLGADVVADVTPLLPGLDALITDYSSLVYDSALVPLPVVFLAPDETEYARRRGFYGTYREVTDGDPARTWPEALAQLDRVLGDGAERERRLERARAIDEQVHAFRDGRNAERVYDAIVRAVSPRRSREEAS